MVVGLYNQRDMIEHINKIKEAFHTQYKFPLMDRERGASAGVVVPDGTFALDIDGKTEYVRVVNDKLWILDKKPAEL